jgi:hypothetical protein
MLGEQDRGISMAQSPSSPGQARRQCLLQQRSIAKTGMAVSMGALVLTGFLHGRKVRLAHVVAGVALLGLSYWHHTLYTNDPLKRSG